MERETWPRQLSALIGQHLRVKQQKHFFYNNHLKKLSGSLHVWTFFLLPSPLWLVPTPSPPPALFSTCILVTVQINLGRSAKQTRTGTAATVGSASSTKPTSESSKVGAVRRGGTNKVPPIRKPPGVNLQLRKSGSFSCYSPLDTPTQYSPSKSPSHYFQICY